MHSGTDESRRRAAPEDRLSEAERRVEAWSAPRRFWRALPHRRDAGAVQIRDFALRLLWADSLAGKLAPPPPDLVDTEPGPASRVEEPARPAGLEIAPGGRARVPSVKGMHDPAQRARILHALANHELQAAELFAWALLALPAAPRDFRRGCLGILRDEQAHLRLYLERMQAHGTRLGDHPVSGHFWRTLRSVQTPLEFVATMGLTIVMVSSASG